MNYQYDDTVFKTNAMYSYNGIFYLYSLKPMFTVFV